jgi:hydroxyacylglutathione hydrolase
LSLQVKLLPAFRDNYIFLVYNQVTKESLVVDPGDPDVVLAELSKKGLQLNYILNTHHHQDHVGGNLKLKDHTSCKIFAPQKEKSLIPAVDNSVKEADELFLLDSKIKVIETPGHTLGSVCYHFLHQELLFAGDTLFSLGCGRLFEGTAEQMFTSLQKIKKLSGATLIYCAHEYTKNNCDFSLSITPNNQELIDFRSRLDSKPTVPCLLRSEIALNPFLFPKRKDICAALDPSNKLSELELFSKLRLLKDQF